LYYLGGGGGGLILERDQSTLSGVKMTLVAYFISFLATGSGNSTLYSEVSLTKRFPLKWF